MTIDQWKTGLIAAIYHDANHQNTDNDNINISHAVQWYLHQSPEESKINSTEVIELIESTHQANLYFPTLSTRLLHDADILQTVKNNTQTNQVWQNRLNQELGTTVNAVSSLDFVSSRLLTQQAKDLLKREN